MSTKVETMGDTIQLSFPVSVCVSGVEWAANYGLAVDDWRAIVDDVRGELVRLVAVTVAEELDRRGLGGHVRAGSYEIGTRELS